MGPCQLHVAAVLLPGLSRCPGPAASHVRSGAFGVQANKGWRVLLADPDSAGWAEGYAQLQAGAGG